MLFKICYWCGLRIDEALSLSVVDFDLEMRKVYLGKTKTEKQGIGTIPEPFLDEIASWLETQQGSLFPGMNYFIVYHWCRKLGEQLNIRAWTTRQSITGEKTITHLFRKTVGKDMLYGTYGPKQPLNIVQKKLRHSSISTTSLYLKATGDDVVSAGW